MTRKPVRRVYGYGIVGKSGKSWLREHASWSERKSAMRTVYRLNEYPNADTPYRVVRLFYLRGKR